MANNEDMALFELYDLNEYYSEQTIYLDFNQLKKIKKARSGSAYYHPDGYIVFVVMHDTKNRSRAYTLKCVERMTKEQINQEKQSFVVDAYLAFLDQEDEYEEKVLPQRRDEAISFIKNALGSDFLNID